jgi:pectate lyase-like protein
VPLTRRRFVEALGAAAAVSCVKSDSPATASATTVPSPTVAASASPTARPPFNVRTYGAVGDGVADDAPAIASAIKTASQAAPGGVVLFPKGRYLLTTASKVEAKSPYPAVQGIGATALSGTALIALQDLRDLTLAGEDGTMLIARDTNASVIGLSGCRNVTIRSIAMDYEPLLFTQGTVAAVDANASTIDLSVQAGYPDPTSPRFADARTWLTVRAADSPDVIKASAAQLGRVFFGQLSDLRAIGGVYRWSNAVRGQLRGVVPGDRFVFGARDNAHPGAIAIWFSQACVFEKVTIHSAPVLAFAAFHDEGLILRDCVIAPLPGTTRLLSTNADGIHSKWNRTGPTLEGCSFSAMHDDAFTFHGTGTRVLRIEGSALVVERQEFFRAGDELAVIDQATGQTRGTAKIRDASLVKWRDQPAVRLELDGAVAGTVSWEAMGGQAALPPRLDQVTPPERRPDLVADLTAIGSGFAVRRCTFARHNGGSRVYAWNGVIEDSRYERINGHPIQIGMELYWPEVYEARNLVVRRNQFVDNAGDSNIAIRDLLGLLTRPGKALGNRDIEISENRFSGYGAAGALSVSNAQDVRVSSNEFNGGGTDVPVALDLCRSVTIDTARALTVSTTAATDMPSLTLKGPVTVRRA